MGCVLGSEQCVFWNFDDDVDVASTNDVIDVVRCEDIGVSVEKGSQLLLVLLKPSSTSKNLQNIIVSITSCIKIHFLPTTALIPVF